MSESRMLFAHRVLMLVDLGIGDLGVVRYVLGGARLEVDSGLAVMSAQGMISIDGPWVGITDVGLDALNDLDMGFLSDS